MQAACARWYTIVVAARVQSVDQLLWQWDAAYSRLLKAEAQFEATGCSKRPTHRSERCGGPGDPRKYPGYSLLAL